MLWRPVGEDRHRGFPRHRQQVVVIVRADGVGHFRQSALNGRSVGERVAHGVTSNAQAGVRAQSADELARTQIGIAENYAGDYRRHRRGDGCQRFDLSCTPLAIDFQLHILPPADGGSNLCR